MPLKKPRPSRMVGSLRSSDFYLEQDYLRSPLQGNPPKLPKPKSGETPEQALFRVQWLLYVQSRGVRHGSPEVIERLGRGEDVDASEYTFRTSTQIETASRELAWLNKGVFISVGGRLRASVIYETYLVG